MFRLLYLLISTVMLLMPFTDPKSKWLVGGVELYGYFFIFCIIVYIPLMVAAFVFFVKSLLMFVRKKELRKGSLSLAAAVIGAVALYGFNYWVFNDIY
ncbi:MULTISPECIES: hypothetical protein [unclassified Pseudomonas]|uniref:hypothetical protein n=1 Tax=unclassified Pseudomonas TaxID=196821 RepID=UPI000A1D648E|nr:MULTISPECIES: hypothetical protein [unclassified Pseudomonas]